MARLLRDTEQSRNLDAKEILEHDDEELKALGYEPSFKREFTNLATVYRSFSSSRILR